MAPDDIPVDLAKAAWRAFMRAIGNGRGDVEAMQSALALVTPELGTRHVGGLSREGS